MIHRIEEPGDWYEHHICEYFDLLVGYIEDVEHHIELSINDFRDNKEFVVTDEAPELGLVRGITFHRGMNDFSWNLDNLFTRHFPSLQRRSSLITLFGLFENELDNLCRFLQKTQHLSVDLNDIKSQGIDRASIYLSKVARLKGIRETPDWSKVKDIQKIRNLVVHHDGKLTDANEAPKKAELSIVKSSEFLIGGYRVTIEKGYLKYVVQTFKSYFAQLDKELKKLPTTTAM